MLDAIVSMISVCLGEKRNVLFGFLENVYILYFTELFFFLENQQCFKA